MSYRRIYLVRHGQTVANITNVVQTADDPLTEDGVIQAQQLAHRIEKLSFDTLVSSDLMRAVHTAQIIGEHTGHTLMQSPLLREMSYASSLYGFSRTGPEVTQYYEALQQNLDNPDFRWGDEESFSMAKERAIKALEYLKGLPGTVVAVMHGHLLKFLVVEFLLGAELTSRQAVVTVHRLLAKNTGITALEERDGAWYLLTWNDHAHLG